MEALLSLLFAGIVGVTVWGWVSLDDSQRFKVSIGVPPSVDTTAGKRTWLLLHLAVGLVIFASSLIMAAEEGSSLPWMGAGLLSFFLAVELWTIRRKLGR